MPRRSLILIVAGAAVVIAAVVAALLPVPYVILSPGPTLNTLGTSPGGQPLILIAGHKTYPTVGNLNMVTVNFQGGPGNEINIFTALRAWLDPHDAVVPQQELFGTGQSQQQVQHQDVVQMTNSEANATAAALTEVGIGYTTQVQVLSTEPGMPAAARAEARRHHRQGQRRADRQRERAQPADPRPGRGPARCGSRSCGTGR